MGGRVGGFIEIENAVPDVFGEWALERGVSGGERGVVSGSYVEAVVVLEEDWPLGCVYGWREALWLDQVVDGVGFRLQDVGGVVFGFGLLFLLIGEGELEFGHGWLGA